MRVSHPFKPIYDSNSKQLILGSMPSTKSREIGFYYGHPRNRFWRILESLFKVSLTDIAIKKQFLLDHHIALWDVLKSCTITKSSDASIKDPIVNDIRAIIKQSQIKTIYTTGKKAYQYYQNYCYPITNIKAICLPSPSGANATWSFEQLIEAYQILLTNTI